MLKVKESTVKDREKQRSEVRETTRLTSWDFET